MRESTTKEKLNQVEYVYNDCRDEKPDRVSEMWDENVEYVLCVM